MKKIVMQHVAKTYGQGEAAVHALKDVSLEIASGEMVAVMGRSGSGKSTLLNIIGGLSPLDRGTYFYGGKPIHAARIRDLSRFRRKHIGFIVQHYALIGDRTIFENVALPLYYQRLSDDAIRERVLKVLQEVGIIDKKDRYPYELSGGQCQRAAIARAIVNDATVLLADEPTGALDAQTEAEIMELFVNLHDEGKTIIMVTHDPRVADMCERTIRIEEGKITDGETFFA